MDKILRDEVFFFLKTNQFPRGPHYFSALECALRIPVLFYCLNGLDTTAHESYALINAIFQHAWWVSRNLSLYSSLGNHTIGEATGLVFAGAVFLHEKEGRRWLQTGVKLLEQELQHQILDDGGGAEQSLSYLRFVVDLYWLSIDFLEKNGLYECGHLKPWLVSAEHFLGAFESSNGRMPSIGDNDNGYATGPGIAPKRAKVVQRSSHYQCFRSAGYSVLSIPSGWKLIFDHGPLGMAPFHNHGHADALSIILWKDNEEIFVDPGTFRYNGANEWRRYLKGTRAHNTVTIDGMDQAVQETSFIWSQPYECRLLKTEQDDKDFVLEAEHTGYNRLKNSVKHIRTIRVAKEGHVAIEDRFVGSGVHDYELNFHLHPDSVIETLDGGYNVKKGTTSVQVYLTGEDFQIVKGKEAPIKGWYSPLYGVKVPSPVLTCTRRGRPEEVVFMTYVRVSGGK